MQFPIKYMNSDNKVNEQRIPFPTDKSGMRSIAESEERFSAEELNERMREFSIRFNDVFRGLSNAEIARRCKTTDSVIKNYIEAKRFPNVELLLQIQRATGVNLNWLLTGKGSRRIDVGDVFTEEEEREIQKLAKSRGRSFNEQVRLLATSAMELLKKI